jgi:hypothetical protein
LLEADGRLKAELTGDWTSRTLGDAPDRLPPATGNLQGVPSAPGGSNPTRQRFSLT